jgi:uncharacterized glyoxalase superfamily protein PhnB
MSMIKLWYIILYVPHVVNAMEFYETILWFEKKFITPEGDYGEVFSGETTLAFAQNTLWKNNIWDFQEIIPSEKPVWIELAFTTENVDALYEKILKNNGISIKPPEVKPWWQTVAYVRDPNGFLLEICTPIN